MKLAARKIGIQTLRLVDREPGLAGVFSRKIGDVFVGRGQAAAAVDHDDRDIGFLECTNGLLDHRLFDALLAAGDAAGVDDEIGNGAHFAETVLAIARQAREIRNQRVTRPRQAIE